MFEEDVPAQQEPLRAALVEDFQAEAELSVTDDEEDVSAQQELPHPALVEDFQAEAELSVTDDEDVSVVKSFNFVYPSIDHLLFFRCPPKRIFQLSRSPFAPRLLKISKRWRNPRSQKMRRTSQPNRNSLTPRLSKFSKRRDPRSQQMDHQATFKVKKW